MLNRKPPINTTPVQEAEFFAAIKDGKIDKMYDFLVSSPNLKHTLDAEKNNALMIAAQSGCMEAVKQLHLINPFLIGATNKNRNNALMLAAQFNNAEVVKYLYKIKPSLIEGSDIEGNNALMIATRYGHSQIVEMLLHVKPELINATNVEGDNALMIAAKKDNLQLVLVIYDRQKDPTILRTVNKEGNNALMIAATNGNRQLVEFIYYKQNDLTILRTVNKEGNNALMIAAINGHYHVFHVLWERAGSQGTHMDCFFCRNIQGNNLVMIAAKNGYTDIFDKMIKLYKRYSELAHKYRYEHRYSSNYPPFDEGRDRLQQIKQLFISQNNEGKNALTIAVESNSTSLQQHITKTMPEIFSWEEIQKYYRDSFTRVVKGGNINAIYDIFNILSNQHISIPEDALIIAVQENHLQVLQHFQQSRYHFNINYKDNNGDTALIIAAKNGNIAIMKQLLASGADINITDNKGYNVFSASPSKEVAALFIAYGVEDLKCPQPYVQQWLRVLELRTPTEFKSLKQDIDEIGTILKGIESAHCTWLKKLPPELNLYVASASFWEKHPGVGREIIKNEEYYNILRSRLENSRKSIETIGNEQERTDIVIDHMEKASGFMASLIMKVYRQNTNLNTVRNVSQIEMQTYALRYWISTALSQEMGSKMSIFGGYVFPELRAELMRSTFKIIKNTEVPFSENTRHNIKNIVSKVIHTIPKTYVEKYATQNTEALQHYRT